MITNLFYAADTGDELDPHLSHAIGQKAVTCIAEAIGVVCECRACMWTARARISRRGRPV